MLKRGNLAILGIIVIVIILPVIVFFLSDDQNTSPYVQNSNATFSGNIQREGEIRYHTIRIHENVSRIHCVLKCSGVDFDLYGRFGDLPTLDDYDFIGYESGGENLYYEYPIAGLLQLMVHSYSGVGHYDLSIEFEYYSSE